jgi:hypothetical protein
VSVATTLTPDRSGIYRAPDDISELERRARAGGLAWIAADLAGVRDKAGLMRALAGELTLPRSFGYNWDALSDSLQDLAWRPAPGYVLHLRNVRPARNALGTEWRTLVQIARLAADYWRQRGRPFIVIVDDAEEGVSAWT